MIQTPYYSKKELQEMGFRALGRNVLISRDARIFSPETVSLGDHVLVDAFTIMNGDIVIGSHVHISSHCELYASKSASIIIGDYSGISSHVSFYSQTDDYIGPCLNNPTVGPQYRSISEQPVVLEKYVMIATHVVVLPGVRLGEGCSFGAGCIVNKSTRPGGLYVGPNCKRIYERDLEEIRRLGAELEAEEQRWKERRAAREKKDGQ